MTQDIWIGIEATGGTAHGWRFDGGSVLAEASGATVSDVTAHLGDGPALIVSEGQSAQDVPAPALPETLPVPGLSQEKPRGSLCPAARLRIAGALAARQNWDGAICLPMADVTHWCQISAGEVVSFQSALTPLLARSLGASELADPDALADTMSRPERLALHLRSATLMQSADAVTGHLLGAEMAAMRPYWLGQRMIVIAQNSLYSGALSLQGAPVETLSPQDCAREGLIALRRRTG